MNFNTQLLNLQRELASFGHDLANDQRRVIKVSVDPIYREMRTIVPVKTGATKRALSSYNPRGSLGKTTHTIEVKKNKKEGNLEPWLYAPYADHKHPWFTTTWRKYEKRLPDMIVQGYEKIIEKKRKEVLAKTS